MSTNNFEHLNSAITHIAASVVQQVTSLLEAECSSAHCSPLNTPTLRGDDTGSPSLHPPVVSRRTSAIGCARNRPDALEASADRHLQVPSTTALENSVVDSDEDFDMVSAIPTYCGTRRKRERIGSSKRTKKKKSTFIRTIFCVPHQKAQFVQSHTFDGGVAIRIPRGKYRTELLALGLCAKLEASPAWTEERIRKEMSDFFLDRFQPSSGNGDDGANIEEPNASNFRSASNNEETTASTVEIAGESNDELSNAPSNGQSRQQSPYTEYISWLSSDEDPDLQDALEASLRSCDELFDTASSTDEKCLEAALVTLKGKIEERHVNYFNINRRNVLDGAVRALNRKSFKEFGRLSIKFSDDWGQAEGAVDAGGPSREFLRLVVDSITNSSIFAGTGTAKYLEKSDIASARNHYFVYGRLISMSIVHGGPGPCCFSQLLYDQILGRRINYDLSLLSTSSVYEQLQKIDKCTTTSEFDVAIDESSLLLEVVGCTKLQFKNKGDIVRSCVKFYVEDRIAVELGSFIDGLNSLGLVEEMKKSPRSFEVLFKYKETCITAVNLTDEIFTDVKLSEYGSNARAKETEVLSWWRDYAFDAEDGNARCSLQQILIFATGADRVPPLGFAPKPLIQFSDESNYPTANTCANILTLPLANNERCYEWFKNAMDFGILNSPGFGVA